MFNNSKKAGFVFSLEQIVKLTLLMIVVLFVFIPLGMAIYDFYFPSIDKELKNSIEKIALEIEDLKKDVFKRNQETSSFTSPIYILADSYIIAYDSKDKGLPGVCKSRSCVCAYQSKGEREIVSCKRINEVSFSPSEHNLARRGLERFVSVDMSIRKEDEKMVLSFN
jgi:hypothetical protein